jgi:hypothetical protein
MLKLAALFALLGIGCSRADPCSALVDYQREVTITGAMSADTMNSLVMACHGVPMSADD